MGRRRTQRGQAPGWAWLLVGLGLGLAAALVVYLRGPRAPELTPVTTQAAPATPSASTTPTDGAAVSPERERRFDFYEILPEFEVVIPQSQRAPLPNRTAAPRTVDEPGSYILQAGSFTSLGDADRLQANLALRGVEARIQRVTIDDHVYHRVRIGPITDLAELDRIRRQLAAADIHEPLLMKAPQ